MAICDVASASELERLRPRSGPWSMLSAPIGLGVEAEVSDLDDAQQRLRQVTANSR
jgi:hypothetical protein